MDDINDWYFIQHRIDRNSDIKGINAIKNFIFKMHNIRYFLL